MASRQSLCSFVTTWSLAVRRVSLLEFVAEVLICTNMVTVRRVSLFERGHPGRVCGRGAHL